MVGTLLLLVFKTTKDKSGVLLPQRCAKKQDVARIKNSNQRSSSSSKQRRKAIRAVKKAGMTKKNRKVSHMPREGFS